MFRFVTPALFVLLWSSSFLGARLGNPYAEPFHFLAWRFAIATVLLAVIALATRTSWPRRHEVGWIVLSGLLIHGCLQGGVFSAVHAGMPLGLIALIGSLQPVFTTIFAAAVWQEEIRPPRWGGVILGFAGVALVASGKFAVGRVSALGLTSCLIAVSGITAGTLVQKRYGATVDLRATGLIQYAVAFAVMLIGVALWESRPVAWHRDFILALGWLVLVNSIGAMALLYIMVARSSVSQVSSLFFLTPGVTAILARLLFREPITTAMLAGIVVSGLGVFLTTRTPASNSSPVREVKR